MLPFQDVWTAIFDGGLGYGTTNRSEKFHKITVEVPQELLKKAQRASSTDVTQTVRTGLEIVEAPETYARLRGLRAEARYSRTLAELKTDR